MVDSCCRGGISTNSRRHGTNRKRDGCRRRVVNRTANTDGFFGVGVPLACATRWSWAIRIFDSRRPNRRFGLMRFTLMLSKASIGISRRLLRSAEESGWTSDHNSGQPLLSARYRVRLSLCGHQQHSGIHFCNSIHRTFRRDRLDGGGDEDVAILSGS